MRPLADVLRRDPDARRMAAFAVLLFAGMWLSKTAQPLYFDAYGALGRFGVSYTVMALAGISTAVTGGVVDRIGPATALRGGAALYAIGLLLRLDHGHVAVAAASGAIAGLGASAVLIGVRAWLASSREDELRGRATLNETATQLGTAIGAGGIAVTVALSTGPVAGYRLGLLVAGLLPLAAIALVPRGGHDAAARAEPAPDADAGAPVPVPRLGLVAFGLLNGFTLSLVVPFIPLVLERRGVAPATIGVVVALAAVTRVLGAPGGGSLIGRFGERPVFTAAQTAAAAVVLGLALIADPYVAALLVCLRAALASATTVAQDLMLVSALPRRLFATYFGVLQASFFVGDAIGGASGAALFDHAGLEPALLGAAGLTVACGVLLPAVLRRAPARVEGRDASYL